jgi:hypothetical protein
MFNPVRSPFCIPPRQAPRSAGAWNDVIVAIAVCRLRCPAWSRPMNEVFLRRAWNGHRRLPSIVRTTITMTMMAISKSTHLVTVMEHCSLRKASPSARIQGPPTARPRPRGDLRRFRQPASARSVLVSAGGSYIGGSVKRLASFLGFSLLSSIPTSAASTSARCRQTDQELLQQRLDRVLGQPGDVVARAQLSKAMAGETKFSCQRLVRRTPRTSD